jgi:hypothetical protein
MLRRFGWGRKRILPGKERRMEMKSPVRSAKTGARWGLIPAIVIAIGGLPAKAAEEPGPAEGAEITYVITFDELIEGQPMAEKREVSTEYEKIGVTIGIKDSTSLPIIVAAGGTKLGENIVAFMYAYGPDKGDQPLPSGLRALTDPIVDGDPGIIENNIVIRFNPSVTRVRLKVIDIDGTEDLKDTVILRAKNADGNTVDEDLKKFGDPETGNGVATPFEVRAEGIKEVIIVVNSNKNGMGYAVDDLVFTRRAADVTGVPRIRVFQESGRGAGDFSSGFLGTVRPYVTLAGPAEFYCYRNGDTNLDQLEYAFTGPVPTLEAETSHLFFIWTVTGNPTDPGSLSALVVHDRGRPPSADGGAAKMRILVLDDQNGANVQRPVLDDPSDDFWEGPGAGEFNSIQYWSNNETDGQALKGIGLDAALVVEFTEIIQGLTSWGIFSSDNVRLDPVLEPDRKVRFEVRGDDCEATLQMGIPAIGLDMIVMPVYVECSESILGTSFGICHPAGGIRLMGIGPGSACGMTGCSSFLPHVDPAAGGTVGVVFDPALPPGRYEVARFTYKCQEGGKETPLEFCDSLRVSPEQPPVELIVTTPGATPSLCVEGISIACSPACLLPARGDVDPTPGTEHPINITDAIRLLNCLFGDNLVCPPCVTIFGDANDDGLLDISDPVYLLRFLFVAGSPPPPPPYPDCGLYFPPAGPCCDSDDSEHCR